MLNKRIWYQSFVHPVDQSNYIHQLQETLNQFSEDNIQFEVHGLSPPDTGLHTLTEFRCAAQTIQNALKAQDEGYDAFVIGHFQEPGLNEIKACLSIPVIGLGEANMLMSCHYGEKIGLITISPVFIPWHKKQIRDIGLTQRIISVKAVDFQVDDFDLAFKDQSTYQKVRDHFIEQIQSSSDMNLEVIIPAGGLPMLLLAREKALTINDTLVVNGIALVTKYTEMLLKLHDSAGMSTSRKGTYRQPSPQVIDEFKQIFKQEDATSIKK